MPNRRTVPTRGSERVRLLTITFRIPLELRRRIRAIDVHMGQPRRASAMDTAASPVVQSSCLRRVMARPIARQVGHGVGRAIVKQVGVHGRDRTLPGR